MKRNDPNVSMLLSCPKLQRKKNTIGAIILIVILLVLLCGASLLRVYSTVFLLHVTIVVFFIALQIYSNIDMFFV